MSKILELFSNYNPMSNAVSTPYIIAEAGVNHEGKIELAKRLIDEAMEGGAQAIKFQTYRAETIASKHSPAYWDTTKEPTPSQFELFKKYDKFWKNEYEILKIYCDKAGIEFMSTPFDTESAIFLNDLMDVFKISSSDITNRPFIEFMCAFKKPIVLSTGASHMWEVEQATEWINACDVQYALLHCVLNYPTDNKNANLAMIHHLKQKFPDKIIGYSDHTLPGDMKNLEIATLLGAKIIEKHFTHDKKLPGNDHYHAMDKEDLKLFWSNIKRTFEVLGSDIKRPLESETLARQNARRSLVAKRDIGMDTRITSDDLTWKRPAFGISPSQISLVIGQKTLRVIKKDQIIHWNDITIKNG